MENDIERIQTNLDHMRKNPLSRQRFILPQSSIFIGGLVTQCLQMNGMDMQPS